jgi:plastocyanin
MQRLRIINVYLALVVLLLALAGAAWLRQLGGGVAQAASSPDVLSAGATQRSDHHTFSAAPATQGVNVVIDNFAFKPKALSVAVGATVTWVNRDDVPHTATSEGDTKVFDSKALDTDDKYSFTFTKPGTYKYYCKIHSHMTGTVVVK